MLVKRDISGVLLFDKAVGDSSNKALQQVKRLFRAKKTGHTGTLDPLASGLLPLMFGQATKFADDLIMAPKRYEATLRMGFSSSTGDAEGELKADNSFQPANLTQSRVADIAKSMVGQLDQVPPMYSALKQNGVPLYKLARQGVEVERKSRQVSIAHFDILELEHHPSACFIKIDVECSKGTYVRTLAEEFASRLGTTAYLTALRRVAIGRLRVVEALSLSDLNKIESAGDELVSLLQPIDSLLQDLPKIMLSSELAKRFAHGQRLPMSVLDNTAGRHRVYGLVADTQNYAFMGTGNLETQGENALLRPERLIQDSL